MIRCSRKWGLPSAFLALGWVALVVFLARYRRSGRKLDTFPLQMDFMAADMPHRPSMFLEIVLCAPTLRLRLNVYDFFISDHRFSYISGFGDLVHHKMYGPPPTRPQKSHGLYIPNSSDGHWQEWQPYCQSGHGQPALVRAWSMPGGYPSRWDARCHRCNSAAPSYSDPVPARAVRVLRVRLITNGQAALSSKYPGSRIAKCIPDNIMHFAPRPKQAKPNTPKSTMPSASAGCPVACFCMGCMGKPLEGGRHFGRIVLVLVLDMKHRKANPDEVCSVKRHWHQCTSGRRQDEI